MTKKKVETNDTPARQLTEIERKYIQEHYTKDNLTLADLVKVLPGVDLNDIHSCVQGILPEMKPEQTMKQYHEELAQSGAKATDLFARDENNGVVVMTQGASSLGDARLQAHKSLKEIVQGKADQIKIMNPNKRVR